MIQALEFSAKFNCKVAQVTKSKPFNFEEVNKIFPDEITPHKNIVIIGDRLLTDILLANLNYCVSIKVDPCSPESEPNIIWLVRLMEDYIQLITKR